jgi:RNA polymerase sigma-70 factor (ECF subfamily)
LTRDNVEPSQRQNLSPDRPAQEAEERLVLLRVLAGDRSAFHPIVQRYTPLLYSLAYRLLGGGPEAEDAVQEIFEKLYRTLPRYDLSRRFHPWLYAIALNHLRTRRRHHRAHRGLRPVSLQAPAVEAGAAAREGAQGGGADPAERAALAEGERLAREALSSLRPKYREVFVLRQLEGLPVREVAEILELPEGTVKTLLHRARGELARRLAQMGWEPG